LVNKKEEEIIEISSSPVDIVDLTAEDDGSVVLIKDDPDADIISSTIIIHCLLIKFIIYLIFTGFTRIYMYFQN